ncbi:MULTISPECIES: anti-sigma factor domain-containing protein [Bacillaceae]|uniref:Anti-sigma factor domain-containing protein n=1 Tax=Evansella alkalicola TaxID=745819 RepID=A0ABS6K1T9_9BACI|nr:anti-sigma factor domain-containing protein [Litchfieldia alkalitelluris]MBU9723884.1 anti-sigma factor domain-containing protein [Bacillus alkalicola]
MKQGIVMEKHRRFMIVMTNDGEFEKAKLQSNIQVGEEVTYSPFSGVHFTTRNINKTYSIPAAAILFFAFFISMMPFLNSDKVYGTVMIDMNPSIEISVDKHYDVIGVKGFNSKGKDILAHMEEELQGKTLNQATSLVIEEGKELGYLTEENYVYISSPFSYFNKELWGEDYDQWIMNMQDQFSVNFISLTVDNDIFQQAKELSLSPAKYMLLEQAKKSGIDLDYLELSSTAIQDIEKNSGLELEKIVSSDKLIVSRKESSEKIQADTQNEEVSTIEEDTFITSEKDDEVKEEEEPTRVVPPAKNKDEFVPPGQARDEKHPSTNNPGRGNSKDIKGDKHPSELKGDNKNRNGSKGNSKRNENAGNNGKGNSNKGNKEGPPGKKGNNSNR